MFGTNFVIPALICEESLCGKVYGRTDRRTDACNQRQYPFGLRLQGVKTNWERKNTTAALYKPTAQCWVSFNPARNLITGKVRTTFSSRGRLSTHLTTVVPGAQLLSSQNWGQLARRYHGNQEFSASPLRWVSSWRSGHSGLPAFRPGRRYRAWNPRPPGLGRKRQPATWRHDHRGWASATQHSWRLLESNRQN